MQSLHAPVVYGLCSPAAINSSHSGMSTFIIGLSYATRCFLRVSHPRFTISETAISTRSFGSRLFLATRVTRLWYVANGSLLA